MSIGVRFSVYFRQATSVFVATIPELRHNRAINIAVAEFADQGGLQRIDKA